MDIPSVRAQAREMRRVVAGLEGSVWELRGGSPPVENVRDPDANAPKVPRGQGVG